MKLNLGCGNKRLDGYVNVDSNAVYKSDQIWDLNRFPYPWGNDSVDEVYMRHVLEHVDNIIAVMDEIWRVLRVGGRAHIEVPYVTHFQALGHPQHKHFFHWGTFGWLDVANRGRPGIESYTSRYYRIVQNRLVFEDDSKKFEPMFNAYPTIYNGSFLAKLIPASVLDVVLEKVK